MTKGNGKDQEQQAAAQPEEQAEGSPPLLVLGMIVVVRESGELRIQYNHEAVKDRVDFFSTIIRICVNEIQTAHHEKPGPQILRPNPPGVFKPPGL